MNAPSKNGKIPLKKISSGCLKGILIFLVVGIILYAGLIYVIDIVTTRAKIVAATSNFRNLEKYTATYLKNHTADGSIPITEGEGLSVVVVDDNGRETRAESRFYTLEHILMAYGIQERPFHCRELGNDNYNYPYKTFSTETRAFLKTIRNYEKKAVPCDDQSLDWTPYNRAEVSLIDLSNSQGASKSFPVIVKNGTIDRINFYLDGVVPLKGTRCAYVVLKNVSYRDACALSELINGAMDCSSEAGFQYDGRLIFNKPSADKKTDVYYYLCHTD
ncbi:hypothetical protein M2103_002251 [Ereboglobus sp. PH5-5]|uniref:hypothetical protein n=1 Tax=Ereboglobus sp. PH5-5 TaxID=2940529 RepID=UPI002406756A|nr:hypothetical protein [Ereboglobus sp. PH5-5]MDF9834016.1 hypothetical protein [Ereboglobus sp. PH5-5]